MTHLKTVPRIIPIQTAEITKNKLVEAVGKVVAVKGFYQLDARLVACEAGVNRKYIFKHFGGLKGLLAAYSKTTAFWPSAEELIGDAGGQLQSMTAHELLSLFFKSHLKALLARPQTLEILAWEAIERNELSKALEEVRERTSLEFFELMEQDPPDDVDLSALVLIIYATANFLAVRSRLHNDLGGVDLESDEGWRRIEDTMDVMLTRTLGSK